jgi:hypothetical protein
MKNTLTSILLLTLTAATAQDTLLIRETFYQRKAQVNTSFNLRSEAPTMALLFLSGAADGFGDVLQFHYGEFKQVFPDADEQWFNPELSWRNKYKNGDPNQGAKYPGSISVFVAGTDAWHASKLFRIATMSTALAIAPLQIIDPTRPNYKKRRGLKKFLLRTLAYSASYHAGQFLVYDVIFSNKK